MTTTINASTSAGLIQSADTSGILQLQTANLPAVTINAAQNTTVNNSLTVNSNLTVTGSTTLSSLNSSIITSATAKAWNWNGLTNNTFLDFENIPSWVKRITVMFNAVSTNGTQSTLIQLGAGSIQTTGYNSSAFSHPSANNNNSTTGLILDQGGGAGASRFGSITINLLGSNIWTSQGILNTPSTAPSAGGVTLLGTLDRLRLTTTGTDFFDAGSVNILYE